MLFCKIVFVASVFIIIYNYIGYALIAAFINRIAPKRLPVASSIDLPSISFIVAAYNEEDVIEKKIENSLQQNYPLGKVEFIFITDGSNDSTPLIVKKYPQIVLLHSPERRGKSAALNRAVAAASNEILIMSDANTFLNRDAIKNIAAHYSFSQVGGVAGEKKVMTYDEDKEGVGSREGLYWKYESFLKRVDSEFYSVVGAAGELFSIRKNLYEKLPDNVVLDDFIISLKTAQKGYRIIYEPKSYAMEVSSVSVKEEKKRKIRIAAGGFQAIQMLFPLFFFWKHWRLSFLYISHRVLRWTLSPLCLITAFISNAVLAFGTPQLIFKLLFGVQFLFYLAATFSTFISSESKLKSLKIAGYFAFMNFSVILGFFRYLKGSQSAVWEKSKRSLQNVDIS